MHLEHFKWGHTNTKKVSLRAFSGEIKKTTEYSRDEDISSDKKIRAVSQNSICKKIIKILIYFFNLLPVGDKIKFKNISYDKFFLWKKTFSAIYIKIV